MKTKMQIKLLLFWRSKTSNTFFINWIKKYFNPWRGFFSFFLEKVLNYFPWCLFWIKIKMADHGLQQWKTAIVSWDIGTCSLSYCPPKFDTSTCHSFIKEGSDKSLNHGVWITVPACCRSLVQHHWSKSSIYKKMLP